ncbi:protein kinase domain-containing protein [Streptomyces sp. NPDC002577]
MATAYIPAPSLTSLVREAGTLPADSVRWIAAGVAEALLTLHGAGIVHRDIKPSSIPLPLDGVRVIDFGISHAHDATRTSVTLSTIAFTSPEQARGERRARHTRVRRVRNGRPPSFTWPRAAHRTRTTTTPCACWPASPAPTWTCRACHPNSTR